jgi:predicted nucleic acid-binding protein
MSSSVVLGWRFRAVASESEYLVTGDNHLLRLGHFGGTKIVKPADFLRIQAEAARKR